MIRWLTASVVCFFSFSGLWAQSDIPTLLTQLSESTSDTAKLERYHELSMAYAQARNVDSAIYFSNRSLELSESTKDTAYIIRSLNDIGMLYNNLGQPKEGKLYLLRALGLMEDYQQMDELKADVCNNVATSFRRLGVIDTSYFYYTEGRRLYEKIGSQRGEWRCEIGLTRLFMENKDFSKAIEHIEAAMKLVDESNRIEYGFSLYFLNLAYLYGGEVEKYAQTFEDWRRFKRKGSGSIDGDARHADLVNIFGNDLQVSANAMKKATEYSLANNNNLMAGFHLQTLGDIYKKMEQPDSSIYYYLQAIPPIDSAGARNALEDVYFSVYEAYKNQDSLSAAVSYLEKHVTLKEENAIGRMKRNISELEIRYETEKKDQTISQQTRERNLLLISGALLLITGVSIIFFLRNRLRLNKRIAESEAKIQGQKITQLEQEKKLATFDAMIQGQEKERQRVARDLHDSIGGLLSTVKAHFNTAQQAETLTGASMSRFKKANSLLDEACEEVRRISHNMMPRALELSGIELAVEDLRDGLLNKGIHCQLEIIGSKPLFDKNKETMIFRILQELCNNIVKHAAASNVLLQLLWKNDQLNILVEDDGKGFDIDSLVGNKGIGLKSIRSRVKFLEGQIHFDSVLHEGTTVNLEIPLL